MSTTRRGALGLAALVLLMLPMFVATAATRTDSAGPSPTAAAIEQEARESNRPASAGLLVLGSGLAITARTLKRRNS